MSSDARDQRSEGERRQLTVLFCDLVGYTPLSQQIDAEDLRELVLSYQKAAAEVIERYEGHIAQYLGDGLLVYFGHPAAHEDDAERAVRASYDILTALQRLNDASVPAGATPHPSLSVRIGIHTGSVVVGQMGAGSRHETLAIGDATNIAARVQGIAEPDTVVISQATLKLVPGLFITRDLGAQALKGVDKPVSVHQVLQPSGVRSRLEAAERLTPFVGRESELALLEERWRRAQGGQGQAVLISAEPGLGKSRLLLMIHAQVKNSIHTWLECRAAPMTRNSAYHPVIELLKRGLQFKDGDTQALNLQRLERALDAIGIDKADAVPLLAPLLMLTLPSRYEPSPYGPELKRRKTMDYLNAWVLALAKFQPLALVFEDLHWSDPSTLELIGRLLEKIPATHILVLMTSRPEFHPAWPQQGHLARVSLGPLPGEQVAAMLDSLAGKPLPPAVAQRIQERTNGVPLFIEEVTKHLLESDQIVEKDGRLELVGSIDKLAIPATLQDSLMARLDKLGEAKEIAQVCAVIGREIPYRLLALVTEQDETPLRQQLKKLTDAELFHQRGVPPESTYTYRHALILDTAYNSLLKSTRARLHGKIATTLEQHFKTRALAQPAVLALHFEQANLLEQAVKYYKAAGEAAAGTAHGEATAFFEKALALLPSLPDGKSRDLLEMALQVNRAVSVSFAKGHVHPEVRAALERARSLYSGAADPMVQAAVAGFSWVAHLFSAQYEAAAKCGEEHVALGKSIAVPAIASNGFSNSAFAHVMLGRLGEALALSEQALQFTDIESGRIFGRMIGNEPMTFALWLRAWLRWLAGYPDEALALTRQAVARAEAINIPLVSCVTATWGATYVLRSRREWAALEQACTATAALCERYGYEDGRLFTSANRGVALGLLGRTDEGLAALRHSIEARESTGTVGLLARDYSDMSEVCLAAGRLDQARSALDQAFAMMEKHDERMWEAELHRLQGELLLAEASSAFPAGAEACLRKALEVSRTQRARSLELRAATSLARLWQKQHRPAEARDLLKPIYDGFTEGFDTPDLQDARAVLAAS